LNSYTCSCPSGYFLSIGNVSSVATDCSDIDECLEGFNGSKVCVGIWKRCQNTLGSFSCVPAFGSIFGLLIGILVVLASFLSGFYFWWNNRSIIGNLPPKMSWSFAQYERAFGIGWTNRGTSARSYSFLELAPNSSDFDKAMELLHDMGRVFFKVESILLVYNRVLISNFCGSFLIQQKRIKEDPKRFQKQNWKSKPQSASRAEVYKKYEAIVARYPWNEGLSSKIIPVCHATDLPIAEKICETGFTALSALKGGVFGKGIYFTTSSTYCLPYLAQKRQPTILLSWLLPGNAYPVVENPQSQDSLQGSAIMNGYNSHFIVTNKKGEIADPGERECYNEIVVPQESQIVPAFLFVLNQADAVRCHQNWARDDLTKEIDMSIQDLSCSFETN